MEMLAALARLKESYQKMGFRINAAVELADCLVGLIILANNQSYVLVVFNQLLYTVDSVLVTNSGSKLVPWVSGGDWAIIQLNPGASKKTFDGARGLIEPWFGKSGVTWHNPEKEINPSTLPIQFEAPSQPPAPAQAQTPAKRAAPSGRKFLGISLPLLSRR